MQIYKLNDTILWVALSSVILTACSKSPSLGGQRKGRDADGGGNNKSGRDGTGEETGSQREDDGSDDPSLTLTCTTGGKSYTGLGGIDLAAGRESEVPKLANRYRIKPISALTGEFQRTISAVPQFVTRNAATFGEAPARWYIEPQASSVMLFANYRGAFEQGTTFAGTSPVFAEAPSEASAAMACTTFAETAWHRTPSAAEVEACKALILNDTGSVTDPKKRWAYGIAAILSSSGFLTY